MLRTPLAPWIIGGIARSGWAAGAADSVAAFLWNRYLGMQMNSPGASTYLTVAGEVYRRTARAWKDHDRQQAEGERCILLNLCMRNPSLFDRRDLDKVMGADRATLNRFLDFMNQTGASKRWNLTGRQSPKELATFLELFANSSPPPGGHQPPWLRRQAALKLRREQARQQRLLWLTRHHRGLATNSTMGGGGDPVSVSSRPRPHDRPGRDTEHGLRKPSTGTKRKRPSPFDSRAQALAWARAHGYVLPPPGAGSTSYKAPAYSSGTTTSYNGASSKTTKKTGKDEDTYTVHEDHGGSHG